MDWIIILLKDKIKLKFTGSVQVNFFKGGISNINVVESLKPPEVKDTGNVHSVRVG